MMSASANTPLKPSPKFTSWKLDILAAAGADPRLKPTYFRMFARVLAALNEQTRIAIVGDDLIADEVPGFGQQATCNRARRALRDLGYWTYEPGRGTRATRYEISDEPVAAVMAAINLARERRADERMARNGSPKKRASSPASVQGKNSIQPCISHRASPASVQVVHPQHTPSSPAHRSEDVTLGESKPYRLQRCDTCGRPASRMDGEFYSCEEHVTKFLGLGMPSEFDDEDEGPDFGTTTIRPPRRI